MGGQLILTTVKKQESGKLQKLITPKPFDVDSREYLITKLSYDDCTLQAIEFLNIEFTGVYIESVINNLKNNRSVKTVLFKECELVEKAFNIIFDQSNLNIEFSFYKCKLTSASLKKLQESPKKNITLIEALESVKSLNNTQRSSQNQIWKVLDKELKKTKTSEEVQVSDTNKIEELESANKSLRIENTTLKVENENLKSQLHHYHQWQKSIWENNSYSLFGKEDTTGCDSLFFNIDNLMQSKKSSR